MNRKDFFIQASTAFASFSLIGLSVSQCKDSGNSEHSDHDHHNQNHDTNKARGVVLYGKYTLARRSSANCIQASQDCLTHCLVEMGNGDKTLQDCAIATRETIAVCKSFLELSSQDSRFIKDMVGLCAKVCKNCADECKKHAEHHEACKICMEACLDCVKEMKKIA